ncbi:metalloregulator ArsR/SmtB family transcription factor [Streptomyces anulatus]|uniref:Metalloregulator ArsR/SmtB family transcription factor n=1 Tax=Streptomyces anulatus TaxID=1892 RepID=A0ABZ1ZNE2_STRAQ|nr:metalloregulator ArsR/SmtB family transcription factor [Streptomyces anulatus]
MSTPLYRLKAEFFKTLGHPVRIRVLELLSERDHAVSEMLNEVGVEAAHLSQQLAVLRRAGLVTARREGSTVHYTLADPGVAELLRVARTILTGVLAGQAELLADLRAAGGSGDDAPVEAPDDVADGAGNKAGDDVAEEAGDKNDDGSGG